MQVCHQKKWWTTLKKNKDRNGGGERKRQKSNKKSCCGLLHCLTFIAGSESPHVKCDYMCMCPVKGVWGKVRGFLIFSCVFFSPVSVNFSCQCWRLRVFRWRVLVPGEFCCPMAWQGMCTSKLVMGFVCVGSTAKAKCNQS